MSTVERPLRPRQSGQDPAPGEQQLDGPRRIYALAKDELAARFGPIEWVLLAILVVVPIAFVWHFASASYFFDDDIGHFYWAHNDSLGLSYAFAPAWEHLAPTYRLTYLALDRVAPMNFGVALGVLMACQAVSAVLLQRILTLLFGRAWWTYAIALAWAISAVYLPAFTWFAAGLHSIAAITATLASIHAYLCWQATGRRGWVVWSLVAMVIGLGFYEKAVLIPLYLLLMRVLLLDPEAQVRDSLRSLRDEWRVWLGYAAALAVFLFVYLLGDFLRPESGVTAGEVLRYLGIFWFEGFSPMVFGVRVSQHGQEGWHALFIFAAQAALIGFIAWSVARRRAAWRAWAFLFITVGANALMMLGRVSNYGAEAIGYYIYYYTEPALLVALAIPFAFTAPRLRDRVAAVDPAALGGERRRLSRRRRTPVQGPGFRLPTARAGATALVALAAYVGVTWTTADSFSDRAGADWTALPAEKQSAQKGRFARAYLDNLRADLAAARRADGQPSLLDHDVPESMVSQLANVEPEALERSVRYTLLSSVLPLFDEQVSFNQPGHLHIVRTDGHLKRTRFVPAAGGSPAELRRTGRLRIREARVEPQRGTWCVVAEGLGALDWKPRRPLQGRDWWLRARYSTAPDQPPSQLFSNPGTEWIWEGPELPSMGSPGTTILSVSEAPTGVPTNAGIRLGVPPFGRLCLRSLEIGYFDPSPPSPQVGGPVSE